MKYLYGDATESPLETNYIELLRDLLDFAAAVMLAQDGIEKSKRAAVDRNAAAKNERRELHGVLEAVERTLASCRQSVTTDAARRSVESLRGAAISENKRADSAVESALNAELGKIHEAIAREQGNNSKRLESLLLKHDLPSSSLWVSVRLNDKSQRYVAELIGKAPCEVAFVIELDIPPGHLLADVMKVERLNPGLTIKIPEESGWLSKSVKWRAHKLGKEHLVGVSRSTKRTTVKLRTNLAEPDTGFDVIFGSARRVAITRLTKGQKSEPFEPAQGDKNELLAFFDELELALGSLKYSRRALRGAQLDGTPLGEHADATVLVHRLIAHLAPAVQEILRRSQSKSELVLKRVLADDRREEIFVPLADLRAKLDPLPPELRRAFAPLGLDGDTASIPAPAPPPSMPVQTASVAPPPSLPVAPPSMPAPPAPSSIPAPAPTPMPSKPPPIPSPRTSVISVELEDEATARPSAPMMQALSPSERPTDEDPLAQLRAQGPPPAEPLPLLAPTEPPVIPGPLPVPTPPPTRVRTAEGDGLDALPPPSTPTLRPQRPLPKPTAPPSNPGAPILLSRPAGKVPVKMPRRPPPRPGAQRDEPLDAAAGPAEPPPPTADEPEDDFEIHSGDSVDIALDELLNNPK